MTRARIERRFSKLAAEGRAGFVAFITAGDPDGATAREILHGLPGAGADIIELGMPFSDPMADGPAIQASSQRALEAGASQVKTLALVRDFRRSDEDTPIILMGYYNPIYRYGVARFLADAREAGVDGLIIVDLPPEEDAELCLPALEAGLAFIRLATPTTDDRRLPAVLANTAGFLYYVSITGITGTRVGAVDRLADAVNRIRRQTTLPVAIGFGIRTPHQARDVAAIADAVVVGSALVELIAEQHRAGSAAVVSAVLERARALAEAVHSVRKTRHA